MQIMGHIFIVLQYIGLWRPVHWRTGWKTKLYNFYTLFMMFAMIVGTFLQFMSLTMSIDNIEEIATNSFMLLTMMLDCGKAANILLKRGEIIKLTNVLQEDTCMPKSETELVIQRKFDRLVRAITLCYGTLVGTGLIVVTLRSVVEDLPQRALPYKAWLPFDCNESLLGYSIVYTTQIVTLGAGCAIGVAFDTLLPGLMLQTCAQLNILKQRFHEIPQLLPDHDRDLNERNKLNLSISTLESKLLSQRVRHHLEIFKFAKTSNDLFNLMIFLQCVVSTAVLCLCLFRLSKMKLLSPEFTSLIMYMMVMSTQIFLYCFYGCRVTLESLTVCDAIYEIDWPLLSLNAQRSLITIMARTLRPIEFISGHMVTLNLESFNSLIKLSYSAYNVLQQSQE